jgi:DNA-directed RNA polymerase delta subunit
MTEPADIRKVVDQAVDAVLSKIDREREREVLTRRFGLEGAKETLELVGETMGITRERVRQIEKASLLHAKLSTEGAKIAAFDKAEKEIVRTLVELGRAATSENLAVAMGDATLRPAVVFLSELSNKIFVTSENNDYHQGIILTSEGDDKQIKAQVELIVDKIKAHGKPVTTDGLFELVDGYEHPKEALGLASISKKLSNLNGKWGLSRWPEVNPKNIRDKIMVVLEQNGKPMHFKDIAQAISESTFSRRNVTAQAIHNELIKDQRCVLVGRGLYGLMDWGYKPGTLSEIIADVLRKHKGPMRRDDIVREVLKQRIIREATVLLTLQNDKAFVKTAKNSYALAK